MSGKFCFRHGPDRCTVVVRQGYTLSPALFNIFVEKILPKLLHLSGNQRMTNLQIIHQQMLKKLTIHCRQCPSEDDRLQLADCYRHRSSGVQRRTAATRKPLLVATWKSASTKAKVSSTASSHGHPPIY